MTPLAELAVALGDALVVDPGRLDELRTDKSGHVAPTRPLALVEARDVDDVRTTLRFANERGIPVVPRGAGTGLAGGAIGSGGELVLSLRGLDRIREIRPDDGLAVVEPGVLNGDLDAALAEHGLSFAPDPASRRISTVGGNIATNAGGLRCVKDGVTRDAVLALRVVLADGRLLELGHRSMKGVTGLDLVSLFVGSEGTLGVVVEATVRVHPRPVGEPATVSAAFDAVGTAATAATALTSAGIRPAMLELLDGAALAAIGAHLGRDLGDRGAQLLVRCDGPGAADEAARALALLEAAGGRAELAADAESGEALVEVRRSFHAAMAALGVVLIEDVAVPRSQLAAMFGEIERIEREFDVRIPTVAHAGDGNLHPNFVLEGADPADPAVPDAVWAAADALFLAALRLGGTLTGEHGVGLLKRRWLGDELGDDVLELQRRVKSVFDPNGILNPGKAL